MSLNFPRTISSLCNLLVMPQIENVQVQFIKRKKNNPVLLAVNTYGAP